MLRQTDNAQTTGLRWSVVLPRAMNEADKIRAANRREFIRDGFRYALLTGFAAVSTTLFKRSGGQLSGQTCINRGICSNCTAFTGCGLPQALSAKQTKRGGLS